MTQLREAAEKASQQCARDVAATCREIIRNGYGYTDQVFAARCLPHIKHALRTALAAEGNGESDRRWPDGLEQGVFYEVPCDDKGRNGGSWLKVLVAGDGDVHVSMQDWEEIPEGHPSPFPSVRIRTWAGGGRYTRTRQALLELANSIRLDNAELGSRTPQPAPEPVSETKVLAAMNSAKKWLMALEGVGCTVPTLPAGMSFYSTISALSSAIKTFSSLTRERDELRAKVEEYERNRSGVVYRLETGTFVYHEGTVFRRGHAIGQDVRFESQDFTVTETRQGLVEIVTVQPVSTVHKTRTRINGWSRLESVQADNVRLQQQLTAANAEVERLKGELSTFRREAAERVAGREN